MVYFGYGNQAIVEVSVYKQFTIKGFMKLGLKKTQFIFLVLYCKTFIKYYNLKLALLHGVSS